jgi:Mrp family chromosome partitioning ATPase
VSSGKGGVGKSLFSIGLATDLAARASTGLLDLDTRSPNLPYLLGLPRTVETDGRGNPRPKTVSLAGRDVPVFSPGFLAEDGVPVTMPGEEVRSAIAGEITSVLWPDGVRYLVLDFDPAPGDSIAAARRWLPRLAAFVVTASDVSSVQDCHRMITALREEGVRILGIVGNMIGAYCPHCHHEIQYGSERPIHDLAVTTGARYVGSLPWDPDFRQRPVEAVQANPVARVLFRRMGDIVGEADRSWTH